MSSMNIERGSGAWRMLWQEHAELRLQHNDPAMYAEYLRKKFGDMSTGTGATAGESVNADATAGGDTQHEDIGGEANQGSEEA